MLVLIAGDPVHVEYAQHPSPEHSADRIFVTGNAVIVLDGATAFVPVAVDARAYADRLGRRIAERLTALPDANLRGTLASAIRDTAASLGLHPGQSPSSTVAILRERPTALDVLVLGDSTVRWGSHSGNGLGWLADHRLAKLPVPQRERYRARLRAGTGYDAKHRQLLRELQTAQRRYHNTAHGYWIAETDPNAAYRALVTAVPRTHARWAVLATDGAFGPLTHLGGRSWSDIAALDADGLRRLLDRCHAWERDKDPDGRLLPRAKQHDDKTLAAVSFPRPR